MCKSRENISPRFLEERRLFVGLFIRSLGVLAMSLDMSDSDIEPFIPGQDENELHPQARGSSTESDSDESSSPAVPVMRVNKFFSKRPLDISKSSGDSCSKKRRSQETGKRQKRHALVHVL